MEVKKKWVWWLWRKKALELESDLSLVRGGICEKYLGNRNMTVSLLLSFVIPMVPR